MLSQLEQKLGDSPFFLMALFRLPMGHNLTLRRFFYIVCHWLKVYGTGRDVLSRNDGSRASVRPPEPKKSFGHWRRRRWSRSRSPEAQIRVGPDQAVTMDEILEVGCPLCDQRHRHHGGRGQILQYSWLTGRVPKTTKLKVTHE